MSDRNALASAQTDITEALEASLALIRVGSERISDVLNDVAGNAPLALHEHRQIAAQARKAVKAGLWEEALDLLDLAAGDTR